VVLDVWRVACLGCNMMKRSIVCFKASLLQECVLLLPMELRNCSHAQRQVEAWSGSRVCLLDIIRRSHGNGAPRASR
jgi:hypothetical protein